MQNIVWSLYIIAGKIRRKDTPIKRRVKKRKTNHWCAVLFVLLLFLRRPLFFSRSERFLFLSSAHPHSHIHSRMHTESRSGRFLAHYSVCALRRWLFTDFRCQFRVARCTHVHFWIYVFMLPIAHRDGGRFFVALFFSLNVSRYLAACCQWWWCAIGTQSNAECWVCNFFFFFCLSVSSAERIAHHRVRGEADQLEKLCVCVRSSLDCTWMGLCVYACVCVRFGQRERGCVRKLYLYIIFVYIIISFWFHPSPVAQFRTLKIERVSSFGRFTFALNSPHNFRCWFLCSGLMWFVVGEEETAAAAAAAA